MAPKIIMNKAKRQGRVLKASYMYELEREAIPSYIESVMLEYDTELVGMVTDRRSRTNPSIYREEFEEALENFNYILVGNNTTTIELPDMETFPWGSGRLRVIQNILEGIIGNFIEVDEEQYVALHDKKPIIEPYDKTVPRKQRIYLLKWNSNSNRRWNEVFPKNQPVRYPFSNMASIDLFSLPSMEFKRNIVEWMPGLIRRKIKEMPR